MDVANGLSRDAVLEHLGKIQNSTYFNRSERLRRFLAHSVTNTLAGETDRLKEAVIGVEVFDRPENYDPKTDSIVRVEAHRLRQKLAQYYEGEGKGDRIRFHLPKGAYSMEIEEIEIEVVSKATRRGIWTWAVGIGLALIGGLALIKSMGTPKPEELLQPRRLSSTVGWATDPVLMPDGQSLIYASDRGGEGRMSLWKRPIDGGEPLALTDSGADNFDPDVSPDGQWIVFRSRRPEAPGVYRQSISGGPAKLLAADGSWPRISPDGKWVLYTIRNEQEWNPSTIYVVDAEGGMPRQLATNFADAHYAIWSEDGRHVLFCGTLESNVPEREHDWWVLPFPQGDPAVKTGALTVIGTAMGMGSRVPPNQWVEQPGSWVGNEVYFTSPQGSTHSLWRIALGPDFRVGRGVVPRRMTQGPSMDLRPRVRRTGSKLSAVFGSGTYNIDLWSVGVDPRTGTAKGEPTRETNQPTMETFPSVDEKGELLAYISDATGLRQAYVRDLRTKQDRRLYPSQVAQDHTLISPDGAWVAFRELRAPKVPILLARSRSEHVHVLHEDAGAPHSWSPDGRYILYEPGATIAFVGRLDVTTRKSEVFLLHPDYPLRGASYSPDGKWIAFHAEVSRERRRLYIAPGDRTTLPGEWIGVTNGDGYSVNPYWAPDGTLLYYVDETGGRRAIWAQRLNRSTKRPEGAPFQVFDPKSARRSLLRLTRSRVGAIGPAVTKDRLWFSMDEQIGDVYYAVLP